MQKNNFQSTMDTIISKVFLWAFPRFITPNQVTAVRFVMVPFVYYYLSQENLTIGFILFFVAACTDFIDGAMARTRNQITDVGKIIDPIADKLLIGSALAALAFEYLIVKIFLIFIGIEIISTFSGAAMKNVIGRPTGANTFGKIKMLLQTLAVVLFIIGLGFNSDYIILISTYVLLVALIFAILSAYGHMNHSISRLIKKS